MPANLCLARDQERRDAAAKIGGQADMQGRYIVEGSVGSTPAPRSLTCIFCQGSYKPRDSPQLGPLSPDGPLLCGACATIANQLLEGTSEAADDTVGTTPRPDEPERSDEHRDENIDAAYERAETVGETDEVDEVTEAKSESGTDEVDEVIEAKSGSGSQTTHARFLRAMKSFGDGAEAERFGLKSERRPPRRTVPPHWVHNRQLLHQVFLHIKTDRRGTDLGFSAARSLLLAYRCWRLGEPLADIAEEFGTSRKTLEGVLAKFRQRGDRFLKAKLLKALRKVSLKVELEDAGSVAGVHDSANSGERKLRDAA
jgi:hypothetical protein